MDAITLLKQDHRAVEKLFKKYEQTSDRAHKTRRRLVDKMIEELSMHASIEEQVFYPGVRKAVKATEDLVLEALEEHHVVKWTLSELETLDPTEERFHPKVTVLMEAVRHHVEEEEGELFPKVRRALKRKMLQSLGDAMADRKSIAPTRPHPRSPDTPPGNLVVGGAAAVADRAQKAGKNLGKDMRKAQRKARAKVKARSK